MEIVKRLLFVLGVTFGLSLLLLVGFNKEFLSMDPQEMVKRILQSWALFTFVAVIFKWDYIREGD